MSELSMNTHQSDFDDVDEQELLLEILLAEEGIVAPALAPIKPVPRGAEAPLSFAQQRLWFLNQIEPGNPFYNLSSASRLIGSLNVHALEQSINAMILRHETLRTSIHTQEDGIPIQRIAPPLQFPLRQIDLQMLNEVSQQDAVQEILAAQARHIFDLTCPPLMQATLLKLHARHHILVFTTHHIISDGWSSRVFLQELITLYEAFVSNRLSPLRDLPIQYADFALWQRAYLRDDILKQQLDYWVAQLADVPPLLQLPFDHPRPLQQSYRGDRYPFTVPLPLLNQLNMLGQQHGATLFMLLLAAFNILLYRYTYQDDIVVGSPIANRNRSEIERLIGFFINTLVLRTNLSGNPRFDELLARVREVTLGAYAHQDLPFEKLVEALQPSRNLSYNPLFQVMLILHNSLDPFLENDELSMYPLEVYTGTAQFDLTIFFVENNEGLNGAVEYSTDLFEAATIKRLVDHFLLILRSIVNNPSQHIATLHFLMAEEQKQLLRDWNTPSTIIPAAQYVHTRFAAQAHLKPTATALVFEETSLSYAELKLRVDHLAAYLVTLGVDAETPVGIYMERSAELVIGLLAILTAGGAYVPLDPTYPAERLAFMIEDAQMAVILTQQSLLEQLPSCSALLICLDDLPANLVETGPSPSRLSPDNIAYVIYTSGSTGQPKGVMVSHHNLCNFLLAMDEQFESETQIIWLAVTSISFDISILELLWTLSAGHQVILQSEQEKIGYIGTEEEAYQHATGTMDFSLFYFASKDNVSQADTYQLLLDSVRYADEHGFSAVWTPERHFHAFGGLYPNPSVMSAALATITSRIALRAGSVVLPLHNPVRVAEEWSLVDNLSGGRVGISFASGWHAHDFVLAPDNYQRRKEVMFKSIETIRQLWHGEAISLLSGTGNEVAIRIMPYPVQPELPIWMTAAGNPDTFRMAGEIGVNLLTHLLGQDLQQLRAKIALYRQALLNNRYDPRSRKVTLMLHTFVGEHIETVRQKVQQPFSDYLRSSFDLLANLAHEFGKDINSQDFTPQDLDDLVAFAFERYFTTSGLFGTPTMCLEMISRLAAIGVDEVACLIDFGVDHASVMQSLHLLDQVRSKSSLRKSVSYANYSLPAQIMRHGVTHLQCTPSLASILVSDPYVRRALGNLKVLLLGGEALSATLLTDLRNVLHGEIHNMYGPTETTIWSTTTPIRGEHIHIGRPIKNTQVYVLDPNLQPVPINIPGELYIGGDGVTRGYLHHPELAAEKYVPDPFSSVPGARLYKTGDLVRYLPDGNIEYLGRIDQQVKLHGYRVELSEIETVLRQHPAVRDAALVVKEVSPGDKRLVAYLILEPSDSLQERSHDLHVFLKDRLPAYMLPSAFVPLDTFPLTPNGKLNRRALPSPDAGYMNGANAYREPSTPVEELMASIWRQILRVEKIGIADNFFQLGGDSILTIRLVSRLNQAGLHVTARQIFQYQTIAELSSVITPASTVAMEQDIVTGEVLLTPIQHWFFAQNLPSPHHYNQALLLELHQPFEPELLQESFRHLLLHHDTLRLRFWQEEGTWHSAYQDGNDAASYNDSFSQIDLSALDILQQNAVIEAEMNRLNASLDIHKGALIRATLFILGSSAPERLFIVIHHLVIDGISWRVLLEDLYTVYEQLSQKQPVALPGRTTSFQTWSHLLHSYAQSAAMRSEAPYWLHQSHRIVSRLPQDYPHGLNQESSSHTLWIALNNEETRALLYNVPSAYHTQIDDVLLAALTQAYTGWTGQTCMLIDLEGHGREEIVEGADISRTIGWFTSLFPVILDLLDNADPGTSLKTIKEQLRAVPHQGIGYGLLRYICRDGEVKAQLESGPQAQIIFNYLGQFDQDTPGQASSPFTLRHGVTGRTHDPQSTRAYLLDINGAIYAGQLRVSWTYSEDIFSHTTIARLAESFLQSLRNFIAHCQSPDAGGYSPSDFPLLKLDQQQLDRLVDRIISANRWQAPGRKQLVNQIEDMYPLSPLQAGILFHTAYAPESRAYFQQLGYVLQGDLNIPAFIQSFQHVVDRHPILRSAFYWRELDNPIQAVCRSVVLPVEQYDWRGYSHSEQAARLADFLEADQQRGFELEQAPLMRITLIRWTNNQYHWIWSYSHLILDGWCLPILLNEVSQFYKSQLSGKPIVIQRSRPYRDYLAWLQEQDYTQAETFWRQQLERYTVPIPLVLDKLAKILSDEQVYDVAAIQQTQQCTLTIGSTARLEDFARANQITLNTLIMGAWAILLNRYNNERDIVFGMVSSGRSGDLSGIETMVGLFINTLPVRIQITPHEHILSWLHKLQTQLLDIRQYEHVPLTQVLKWSGIPHASTLFETILVFENYPLEKEQEGLFQILDRYFLERTNYPLALLVTPGKELRLKISYDPGRFAAASIEQLLNHLQTVVTNITLLPEQPLSYLPIITDQERHQLVNDWNATEIERTATDTILTLFAAQVARTPDAVALVFEDCYLTYAELNRRTDRLGSYLRHIGTRTDELIGLYIERSLEMVTGLLGILKAGCAYIPLDPSSPKERLAFMLKDSQINVLLTQRKLLTELPSSLVGVVCLDSEWSSILAQTDSDFMPVPLEPDNLAYVIYTSGSTGRPKGVMISHRSIANRLLWMQEAFHLCATDTVLQKTPFSFDVSVWEFFWPLIVGAKLAIAEPGGHQDTNYMVGIIEQQSVSVMHFVPSMLQIFLDNPQLGRCSSLKKVICSGEALPFELQNRFFACMTAQHLPIELFNLYGPTETAVDVTYWQCSPEEKRQIVPIGRPIANTQVYLLDASLELVPVGVLGEVYIGGVGLARGYAYRPDLTAERFIPDPFNAQPGSRLYKTGDLACFTADGNIVYLGRSDSQVKLHGFRIELGEIEYCLGQHPAVREITVMLREDTPGHKRLVAYVVVNEVQLQGKSATEVLRRFGQSILPDYMLPAAFVVLEHLPLNANGKVNQQALPVPEREQRHHKQSHIGAHSTTEKLLVNIWEQVLHVDGIDVQDNFFELGGDSILSMQIVSAANRVGLPLTLKQLLNEQTVANLSAQLASQIIEIEQAEQGAVVGAYPLTPVQHWFFEQSLPDPYHYNQALLLEVHTPLNPKILRRAVKHLLAYHDVLRSRFIACGDHYRATIIDIEAEDETPFVAFHLADLPLQQQQQIMATQLEALHMSLNLGHGPLIRVAFFDFGPQKTARLFLVAHHLVVDGVSWRILLNDLHSIYEQINAAQEVSLLPKTTSYKEWATRLEEYAHSIASEEHLAYWRRQTLGLNQQLPTDFATGSNTRHSTATLTASLSKEETQIFLHTLPKVFGVQMNELILTALSLPIAQWAHQDTLLVDLEGHGREPLFDEVDLTRTVGWFTSIFPVVLPASSASLEEAVRAIKQCLDSLPKHGLSYGLLRYLSANAQVRSQLADLPAVQILFNYFGQFDQSLADTGIFALAPEPSGPTHGMDGDRLYLWEINAYVLNHQFQLSWTYGTQLHKQTTIENLMQGVLDTARRLIEYAQRQMGDDTETPAEYETGLVALLRSNKAHINLPFPLTDVQHAYWMGRSGIFDLGKVATHIYIEVESISLDITRFNQAWQRLIQRHDMLRAIILADGRQQILAHVEDYTIKISDLRGLDEQSIAQTLDSTRQLMSHQVLPTDQWPLFEIRASLLDQQRTRLHLSIDYMIVDAWSLQIIFRELFQLYQQPESTLPTLEISFRDYVLALQDAHVYKQAEEYWWKRLEALPPAPELPLAKSPSAIQQQKFVRWRGWLAPETWRRLKRRAGQYGLTPSSILLAAFAEVLSVWSKSPRFTINLTLFNRLPIHPQINNIVGDFTSLTLLAIDNTVADPFAQADSFAARARRVQQQLWEDLDHRNMSGVRVLRELARRQGNLHPASMPVVFTSTIGMSNPTETASLLNEMFEEVYSIGQTPQVWLDHQVSEQNGGLRFNWDVVEELFPDGFIQAMFQAFSDLLQRLADENQSWPSLSSEIIPTWQLKQRATINATTASIPRQLLHKLFESQIREQPEQVAVISSQSTLTYGQLYNRARYLSRQLRELAVQPNTLVGIVMDKGWEQVVAALGILQSGAAYLPIDAGLPPERIAFFLQHGDVRIILTQSWINERLNWLEESTRICVDLAGVVNGEEEGYSSPSLQQPQDLAYVIYTSGSTGTPKGVMIDHQGALNTILDLNERFHVGPQDRVLALSALSFDLSVYDIFGLLAAGGTIILPETTATRDPARWLSLINQHGVTLWNTVPTLLQMLVDYVGSQTGITLPSLRLAMLSGDWIPVSLPERFWRLATQAQIYSLGGATEASIWSILYPIEKVDPDQTSIPYGKPMLNQTFHVLNQNLQPCPIWVPGTLYIGGMGLALGYWRDEEKTRSRFIHHPQTGERLYDTGDIGRYLPDGNIEFLGREDFQVKVRGHRIELGEVETVLNLHPAVRANVVLALGEKRGNKRLVGYVVPDQERAFDLPGNTNPLISPLTWERLLEAGNKQSQQHFVEADPQLARVDIQRFLAIGPQLSNFVDRFVNVYLCLALRKLGIFTRPGERYTIAELVAQYNILPRYSKWLYRCLLKLADDGLLYCEDQVFYNTVPLPAKDVDTLWAEVKSEIGDVDLDFLRGQLDAFRQNGERLVPVLMGEVYAVEFLFPEGDPSQAEHMYQNTFHHCNSILASVLSALVEVLPSNKHLRILEIGAGVGGTTASILPVLSEKNTEYVYTDISRYFIPIGRKNFGQYPFVKYQTLDIEKNPQSQGYELGSFDVIVAASVLHATRDLKETMHYVRSLLKNNGILLMIEETKFHHTYNLSMGLQQGFDHFEDFHLRPLHALLSAQQWQELLLSEGFDHFALFNRPGSLSEFLGLDVFLVQASSVAETRSLKSILNEFLREKLPDYMVPSDFILIPELPLTFNGKIDYHKLMELAQTDTEPEKEYLAPRNATEKAVVELWQELLDLPQISIDANFFALGGDSLIATRLVTWMRDTFKIEIPIRSLFEAPTVAELALKVEQLQQEAERLEEPTFYTIGRGEPLPLSFAQQRLWFLDQLMPNSHFYNVPVGVHLRGVLELAALERSIHLLIQRHETLRTTFALINQNPAQVIAETISLVIPVIDLSNVPVTEQQKIIQQLMQEEARSPFDLLHGPLLRIKLLRIGVHDHILLSTMHHIVSDGWSMGVLIQELTAFYKSCTSGNPANLPALPIQYADFAYSERQWLQGQILQKHVQYWQRRLANAPALLHLPTDRPRPETQTYLGATVNHTLSQILVNRIELMCRRQELTMFMVLLAAFDVLLHYYSGQDKIVVGTDVANRTQKQTTYLIGFFVNQLVLFTDLAGITTFSELLEQVREVTLGAYEHQELPFNKLVEILNPERTLKYEPLFQVKLVLQNVPAPNVKVPGLSISPFEVERGAAQLDLNIRVEERPVGLTFTAEYSTDLFDETTIVRWLRHFEMLLNAAVDTPDVTIEALEAMLAQADMQEQVKDQQKLNEISRRGLKSVRRRRIVQSQEQ